MPLPPLDQPISGKSSDPLVMALLEDLQANILKGHGRDHALHLFFAFDSGRAAEVRAAIRQLSGQLKTAAQQLAEAEHFKATGKDGGTVRCFFLSASGCSSLDVGQDLLPAAGASPAFSAGMKASQDKLADPAVESWDAAFQQEVHAMLLLADQDLLRLQAERDSIVASLSAAGMRLLGEERGLQQKNARGEGVEHFGYIDGRSQPLLLTEQLDDERLNEGGSNSWDPTFPPKAVLVLDDEKVPERVLGSYFVFRKLEQNVKGFKDAEERFADDLGLVGDARELAGAMLVGRFEDGTPVVLRNRGGMGAPISNNFNYAADPAGLRCPVHAHIRKTNPRGAGGFEEPKHEKLHLMPRRGITYGEREPGMADRPEGGVGLLFMCYQASLETQFEFMQSVWANNPTFPAGASGALDPVIGQGINPPGSQQCPVHWGDASSPTRAADFAGFVTMKGGEYFFAPVISSLRTLP